MKNKPSTLPAPVLRAEAISYICSVCVYAHTRWLHRATQTPRLATSCSTHSQQCCFSTARLSPSVQVGVRGTAPHCYSAEIWQMFEEFMCTDINAAAYNQLQCYAESLQHAAGWAAVITAWTNKQKVCVIPEVWLESQAATSQKHLKQTNQQESNQLSHHYSVQFPDTKVHGFSSCFSYCLTAQNNWKSY